MAAVRWGRRGSRPSMGGRATRRSSCGAVSPSTSSISRGGGGRGRARHPSIWSRRPPTKSWLKGWHDPSKEKDIHVGQMGLFFVNGAANLGLTTGGYYTSAVNEAAPGGATTVGLTYQSHQMYVEYYIPKNVTHPYPVVMIHGGAQTQTNFWMTPDGQPGWGQFFLANGYAVYIADQVGRGNSGYAFEPYGAYYGTLAEPKVAIGPPTSVTSVETSWSIPQLLNVFPHGYLHTQWPGTGMPGSYFFDQFMISQVSSNGNAIFTQAEAQAAGAALLDRIGPAIIVTHSQSGVFGPLIADKRPNLVKGVVTVEGISSPHGYIAGVLYPSGYNPCTVGPATMTGPRRHLCTSPAGTVANLPGTGGRIYPDGNDSPYYIDNNGIVGATPYGITTITVTYSPAWNVATDTLNFVQEATPDGPDVRCWLQGGSSPKQLVNLIGIPHLMITRWGIP